MTPGAMLRDGVCSFTVWAPRRRSVAVHLPGPPDRIVPLARVAAGYWQGAIAEVAAGARYWFWLDDEIDRSDPASASQPDGVHGASQVVDHAAYNWQDAAWRPPALAELVFYELHVGTFTPAGTFAAIIPRLAALRDLGITAIELMPVGEFPGTRNWGYDGTCPFSVHTAYGGPDGLRALVDACHACGLAVIIDVVYNHLGPEGNYLWDYGPYFTDRYRTPWGDAVNFDGAGSDGVRDYFIANASHWLRCYHADGLRLDATHAIHDARADPFLAELARAIRAEEKREGRAYHLIAESDRNDSRLIRPESAGGIGIDAQWNDDYHHALHVALTGEHCGYYADYQGIDDLATAWRQGYVYTGQHSVYRGHRHGNAPGGCRPEQFVICSQNHDQVGNRPGGDRLLTLAGDNGARLAAVLVLLAPGLPLLFMGEEYGEEAPFLYFIDHGDPVLAAAVRDGRAREFPEHATAGTLADPSAPATRGMSTLRWHRRDSAAGRQMLAWYTALLALRRTLPAATAENLSADCPQAQVLCCRRPMTNALRLALLTNFARTAVTLPMTGTLLLDSDAREWGGAGVTQVGGGTITVPPRTVVVWREGGGR